MNINLGILGLLAVVFGLHITYAYFSIDKPPAPHPLLVPIQVGKTKTYVSQTRDAGMFIEKARRCAIINSGRGGATTFKQKGSTNGSLEYFFLTGVCPGRPLELPVCPPNPESVIWSNGDADDVICDIVDAGGAFGGYEVVDGGGAFGNVCDIEE